MKTVRFSSFVLGLGVSVLLAGCSGGGGSSNSGTGSSGGGNSGGSGTTVPAIASITPTSVSAGSGQITLTVNGSGFLATTTVQVGGVSEPTTYISATQVTATVPASQLTSGAQLSIVVMNGSTGSGSGTPANLVVTNPAPTIASVAPSFELVGASSPVITVTGTGFVPTTSIQVNGNARSTTFTSSTQVSVTLSTLDVATAGSLSLTAVNATPGGGTSTAATVSVNDPVPTVSSVSPRTVLTGSSATTVTITGTNFVAASTVLANGSAVPTTYVSPSQLTISISGQTTPQVETLSVNNPAPGGGTISAGNLVVLAPTATPVISSVSPTQLIAGSGATSLYVYGSNLSEQVAGGTYVVTGTVLWNGTALTATGFISGANQELVAQVPASLLTSVGTASVTVSSVTSTPAVSNAITVNIVNPPPPTLTSISPAGGPVNSATAVTLLGTGFTSNSTVALNGATVPSVYKSPTSITLTIPAASAALPGIVSATVTTPAPGGGTTAALPYTAYVGIPNNDIAYSPTDGLLYASVPGSIAGIGNSVVGIDPMTGTITRQIWVGSNPDKLALSTDGTQLFVGIDGAASVAQINLSSGQIVNEFSLGGGQGVYNPPFTAAGLAAVPGQPNSVAVFPTNGIVTIYDSGVARPKNSSSLINTYFDQNSGSLAFGSSSSTLYVSASPFQGVEQFTVDSTGITAAKSIYSTVVNGNIQYDNGYLYLPNGVVLNASTGALQGTFYATTSSPATGAVISDSTLGLAFIASSVTTPSAVLAFNESTFNPAGNVPFSGGSGAVNRIVRWGQNGLAFDTSSQIFLFQSSVVKDLSPSPADLSVSLSAPQTATTGSAISYVATIDNGGPNASQSATLTMVLDSSLIVNSITPSQGTCGSGSAFTCDIGSVANGSSATVTVSVTPTTAGTFAGSAQVSSVSYDPTTTNNQAATSTTVTGSLYSMAPVLTSISPALVQAGSGTFSLTIKGTGFNPSSTVAIGGSAVTTTYVNATQITASVDSSLIKNYGWAPVTVSNPAPGGGMSQIVPLTIYGVVNVTANSILFDPFSQLIYASVPSASTNVTGNSIVSIDPVTETVGTPIPVGSEPNLMAETSDGDYLYIGLTGSDSLAQFDLLHQTLAATIPLSYTQGGTTSSTPATSLATMPGADNTLAIGVSNGWGNFGIFDVTGNTGTFRTNLSGIYEGVKPVFADATHLYAFDSQTSGAEFYRYSVGPTGLTLIDGTTLNGMGGFQGGFALAGGVVYGEAVGIANPSTTPPSQIATMPLVDFYGIGVSGADEGTGVIADPSTQKEFLMEANTAGTWAYGLVRYDTVRYLPETWLTMPANASAVLSNWNLLRWGQDGIALLSTNSTAGSQATSYLMLLRGPFVTPQELSTGTAASLTSSSSSTITHGAGNMLLTLTGANFLPGVAVTWNGGYRTTTIVDSSHVTVAIPASDLANAGSASVIATNPGAPASSTLTIAIN